MLERNTSAEFLPSIMNGGTICTSSPRNIDRPFSIERMTFPFHVVFCFSHRWLCASIILSSWFIVHSS